ncbi:MAG: endo alpha-1,4 polygalactosaminidase [Bdellovibrio sp.]
MIKYLIILIMLTGCSSLNKRLIDIKQWGYQLQAYRPPFDLERIQQSKKMLWVIDYSLDGTESRRFRKDQLEILKKNNNVILSYLSVGEANSFRYYFEKLPKSVLAGANKDWGSIKVKFWEKEWQDMLLETSSRWGKSYLERILESGFDGVYLDIVDGFENFPKERKLRAQNMADLIIGLSQKAKKVNPNFKIFIQNGIHIISLLDDKQRFLNAIDGAAIESLFFLGKKDVDNSYNPQTILFPIIEELKLANKKILAVEYLTDETKIKQFFDEAKQMNLLPVVSSKLLDGHLIWPETR